MKRLAVVLLGVALFSVGAWSSDYDLYIYDYNRSAVYDSSTNPGEASEYVTYTADSPGEVVRVEVEEYETDTLGLGFFIEIWIDDVLCVDEREVYYVPYEVTLASLETLEAYIWPVSEWTVSTIDYGDDSADGTWDGFAITIEVNGMPVWDTTDHGEIDYTFEVLDGDSIYVELASAFDDYDIELYDGYGDLVEYSNVGPLEEPDRIQGDVGGTFSSAGHRAVADGDDTAVLFCGAVKGERNPLGLVFPALVGLLGLSVLTRRAVPVRG